MGQNLILNMNDHGFTVASPSTAPCPRSTSSWPTKPRARRSSGPTRSRSWCSSLKRPRRVMMLVKAGKPVDEFIEQLDPAPRAGRHHHRRRQLALPGHDPPRRSTLEAKGLLFIGTGVSGGEEGARHGPSHHARRFTGRLAAREGDLPGDRRQGRRRRALLRLGGRKRRRPLREDGPQRHRVRRHAAHLRGLPADEGRPRHDRRRDAPGLRASGTRASSTATSSRSPATSSPSRTTTASRSWTRSSTPPARRAPASGR